ncbi:uncharacterized protein BJ212DRAFT_1487743 [Suillus subaureus]|uniref:Uncharacterized protein n=1 Tax=Suillus subaureus TaxID=48587 RepID=A0A9P7J3Q7_9AGAM|nr:uncharacterized protein BJ212DRAFT_1487743 [Suillus subaureus]KAG1801207.1 hypothetical protein BJ212DRAFT_1487743 [Suillus subaureus]
MTVVTPTCQKQEQCLRSVRDSSESQTESSLSDDNTINQLIPTNSPFPSLPPQPMFILRPAVFNLETPILPLTSTDIVIEETAPLVTTLPPIPQPKFLKPPSLPSKPLKNSTNPFITPALQVTAPTPNAPPSCKPPSSSSQTLPTPSTLMSASPVMSNVTKGMVAMPRPGSHKVPLFEGKTSKLLNFFELFKDLAASCALMDEQKCKTIVRYTDTLTKRFWVMISGYESKDYALLKRNILAKYPHANWGIQYTIRDLEHLILNTTESEISTKMELLQYYHQLCPIAAWLITNSKIMARECDWYFLQGLPQSVCQAID